MVDEYLARSRPKGPRSWGVAVQVHVTATPRVLCVLFFLEVTMKLKATAVEYGLLLALIGLAFAAVMQTAAPYVGAFWERIFGG